MAVKDFFGFFKTPKAGEKLDIDYLVFFDVQRPDIKKFEKLKVLGDWVPYGDTGYRIWCALPKEKFEEIIVQETGISVENFTITRGAEFAGL